MSSQGRRAGGGRGGSRSGLGTASGRPTTGRPMTGRPTTGRPTTATARPGTSRQQPSQMYDERNYDEEEEYESDEDEDVFAFVPPDLGAAPEIVHTSDITAANPALPAARPSTALDAGRAGKVNSIAGTGEGEEDETFYYDEATGAVYDSQGKLVDMPAGFDASAIHAQRDAAAAKVDHPLTGASSGLQQTATATTPTSEILLGEMAPAMPEVALRQDRGEHDLPTAAPSYRGKSFDDPLNAGSRISLDRKPSSGSSINVPILPNARAISGFTALDALPELDSRHNSPLRPTSRDVGLTATGQPQLDESRRGSQQGMSVSSGNVMRQRNNRHSQAEVGTPVNELKFNLDGASYDEFDDLDGKNGINGPADRSNSTMLPAFNFSGAEAGGRGIRVVELEMETEEDSPYPEVRASVSNIDDPDMPINTFRAWFLSFVLATLAGSANMLLNLRYPAPTLTPIVVQLITYPCGKLMAAVLPIRTWTLPRWLGGKSFSLNPGLFNIKEHTLISIVMNISIGQAYAINSTMALSSPQFYNDPRPIGFTILFVISSQLLGFSAAGFCRRFLVYPASMIWPQNLVTATILNTLHAEEDGADGSMTRFRFFSFVFGGAFIWYFVPGFLFQALSSFSWLCWIFPNNFVVNTLFGVNTGLGLSVLTFDWTQIGYIGSPLVYPWWSEVNIIVGFVVFVCIISPILYFTNTLYVGYLPFNSSSSYDRFGETYDILKVVTDRTKFDQAAYDAYSPLYLPVTYMMLYTAGFAVATSVLVHTILYHGKSLWKGLRSFKTEEDDIHAKFMKRYKEVPEWWYLAVGLVMFGVAIIANEAYSSGLPVWALIVSILIPVIYILPSGFIYAMTGSLIGTNLIGELVAGYALPGDPIANQIFKVYALQTLVSGLAFTQDLKLGHYMKIPPRISFCAQLVFSFWIAIVQIGVQQFMFSNVSDLCTPDQKHRFTCPHARVFFTSSIVWGIIGPQRLFGEGGLYAYLYWALLVGALLPIPVWILARKYPRSWIKFISVPIALNGMTFIPPGSGLVYTSWFATAFVFQYLIRKHNFRWWSKYNFVTSAALDSGTIISTIVVFLVLQLPRDGSVALNWWGNTVSSNTLDSAQIARLPTPANGFAPAPGSV